MMSSLRNRRFMGACVTALLLLLPPGSHAQAIDAFAAKHASSWRPGPGALPPQAVGDGLQFAVRYTGAMDRVYWDLDRSLNLSRSSGLEIELSCPHPASMRSLAVYFRSGNGWYIWNKPLSAAGRQRLQLQKRDFSTEGSPSGWQAIDKMRISPWKGMGNETTLTLHRAEGRNQRLFLIQAGASAPNAAERSAARRATERMSRWLTRGGISHAIVPEEELAAAAGTASVIVLPYNPRIPAAGMRSLGDFTRRGGKLIACYSSDDQLANLMQVRLGAATNTRDIARWRAISFTRHAPPGMPERIHQQSWSIGPAKPANRKGQVIAWWADAAGRPSKDAAVIATPAGYWFTHILLDDDNLAKQRMMTALLASLDPSLWRDAAAHAVINAGRIDGWADAREAVSALNRQAAGHPDRETIEAFTQRISDRQRRLEAHHASGRYREAVETGYELTDLLIGAYSLAQRPMKGEMRGVWEHDGAGWYPGDWDRTARLMADSGINTIFINATWAGLAHYASDVLPESFTYRYYGDQLAACLKAARKHGLKVHAWIVCWNLENAPEVFTKPLRKTDRLQRTSSGTERLWMNPAHPESVTHHLAIIREILDRYDVDGIHLDYIRYPDGDACYSSYTRKAFEKATGIRVAAWPADVRSGGPHQQSFTTWRAGHVTGFVKQAGELVRSRKPGTVLSAAVWGGYPQVANSIGQDWMTWLEHGYVDFLCPMNYANDLYSFTALVDQQLSYPATRGRIFPGIGVTANESQLRGDQVVEQILALRQRGINGFVLYDLSQTLVDDTLPTLRKGVTRPAR